MSARSSVGSRKNTVRNTLGPEGKGTEASTQRAARSAGLSSDGYSMLSEVDALVTWDQGDLARDHTRRIVQAYGRRERLSVPLIGAPEEVAQWLGRRIH